MNHSPIGVRRGLEPLGLGHNHACSPELPHNWWACFIQPGEVPNHPRARPKTF
jgi:hypothetical protein